MQLAANGTDPWETLWQAVVGEVPIDSLDVSEMLKAYLYALQEVLSPARRSSW